MKVVALLLVGVPIWFDYASAAPCTIQSLRSAHPEICKPPPSEAPRSEAKMRSLFTEVQQIMREFILQGRPSSELSSEERSLLNRISSIEFKGFHPCSGLAVATYHRDEHKVSMCSSLRSFPVAALVGMMAHEMGHAPDSCSVQCPLLHAPDRSRVRLPRDLDQDSRRQFDQTMRQSTRPIHFSPWELMDRREVIDQWRAQGVVEVVGQAMPLSRYPLNRIRMRLVNHKLAHLSADGAARFDERTDKPTKTVAIASLVRTSA